MVLCLICYGVYTGVKKAQKTIEAKKERKRLANGEKTALSAADEKALLAARENNGTATTTGTCDHGHGEGAAECETCKRALLEQEEEVPPPYVEAATSGASTSVVRA